MSDPFRVLLVEDEAPIRTEIAEFLKHRGYEVCEVESAEEALRHLGEHTHQVAIVDRMLPGLDGHRLCQRIHKHFPMVATIMLTALPDETWATALAREGLHDYLAKPAKLADIQRSIVRVIASRAARRDEETRWLLGTLSAIRHRFGNDLWQLRSALDLLALERGHGGAEADRWLQSARAIAGRLSGVLDQMTGLTLGPRGRQSLMSCDLQTALNEVAAELHREGQAVEIEGGQEKPMIVHFWPAILPWVLRAFLEAARSVGAGHGEDPLRVVVTLNEEGCQLSVCIPVGAGDSDLEDRLLRPYVGTFPGPEDSGAGLAGARLLVEDSGGRIWTEKKGKDEATLCLMFHKQSKTSSGVSCRAEH